MVDIVKLDITHLSEDPFGHVKSAKAFVKGPLLDIDLELRVSSQLQLVTRA